MGKTTILILGIIVVSVIVSLVAAISLQSQPLKSNTIPEIRIIYNGQEYAGGLLAYTWKGSA